MTVDAGTHETVESQYGSLLMRFLAGQLSAAQLQSAFFERFKNETQPLNEETYRILDALFGDLDSFEPDADARAVLNAAHAGFYIDEPTLRQHVARACDALLLSAGAKSSSYNEVPFASTTMRTWGYSGLVGEWSVDVPLPSDRSMGAPAAVDEVLRALVIPISVLHRPCHLEVSWAELDATRSEIAFHELEEHAVTEWDDVREVVRGLGKGARVAISALFVRLDTLLVGDLSKANSAGELQLSISPADSASQVITVTYTTSIDVWLTTTYGPQFVPRDNRAAASQNGPRLAAFLTALGALGRGVRAGSSQLYASVIDVNGFRDVVTLPERNPS